MWFQNIINIFVKFPYFHGMYWTVILIQTLSCSEYMPVSVPGYTNISRVSIENNNYPLKQLPQTSNVLVMFSCSAISQTSFSSMAIIFVEHSNHKNWWKQFSVEEQEHYGKYKIETCVCFKPKLLRYALKTCIWNSFGKRGLCPNNHSQFTYLLWPQDKPRLPQDNPRMTQDDPRMTPGWPRGGPRITQGWPQDDPRMTLVLVWENWHGQFFERHS